MEEIEKVSGFMEGDLGGSFEELRKGCWGAVLPFPQSVERDQCMSASLFGFTENMGEDRDEEVNVHNTDHFLRVSKGPFSQCL